MSLRSDALRTLAFQFFSLGAGLVTNIVVARTLGPAGKGVLSFLGYTLFIVVSLGSLGMQSAAIQHLGKKTFPSGTVSGTQLILSAWAGIACALLLAVILPAFRQRMQIPAGLLLPFLLVAALSLVQTNLTGIVIGLGRIRLYNWMQLLTPAAWSAGAVAVLWALGRGLTAGVLTWMGAQALGSAAVLGWVLLRTHPKLASFGPAARRSLRFGLEAYLAGLVWTLLLRSDGLMLGYLAGPASVGIYSVSVLMAEMLWYLPRSLTLAMNPRIAALPRAEASALAQQAARVGLYSVLAAGIGLILIAPLVIRLAFGRSFAGSTGPLLLLLPGIVAGALTSALSLYFVQQLGRPRVNAMVSGAGLLLNFVLNLFWIPAYGAAGAALASSVSYILVAFLLILQFRPEPGFSWTLLLRPRRGDVSSLVTGVRLLLRRG